MMCGGCGCATALPCIQIAGPIDRHLSVHLPFIPIASSIRERRWWLVSQHPNSPLITYDANGPLPGRHSRLLPRGRQDAHWYRTDHRDHRGPSLCRYKAGRRQPAPGEATFV